MPLSDCARSARFCQVEGLWNDCWWEGRVREYHWSKGVLFEYDRWHANWLWLPLRCTRPRPSFDQFYPDRPEEEAEEEEVPEFIRPPAGTCGSQGCMLPNNHSGLCQVRVQSSRRETVQQRQQVAQQIQIFNEIQRKKDTKEKVRTS